MCLTLFCASLVFGRLIARTPLVKDELRGDLEATPASGLVRRHYRVNLSLPLSPIPKLAPTRTAGDTENYVVIGTPGDTSRDRLFPCIRAVPYTSQRVPAAQLPGMAAHSLAADIARAEASHGSISRALDRRGT